MSLSRKPAAFFHSICGLAFLNSIDILFEASPIISKLLETALCNTGSDKKILKF